LNDRALAAQRAGQFERAEALYRESLAQDRRQPGVLYALAGVLERLQKGPDAIALLHEALALVPGNAKIHHSLGLALCDARRYDEAIDHLRRAVTAEPRYARGWNNLGNALRDCGQKADAASAYREALRLEPNYALAQLNLGGILVELSRFAEAEGALRRALQLQPGHYESLVSLGAVLRQLQRPEEAAATYREAIALQPERTDARLRLGATEQEMCDWRHFDEFIALVHRYIADVTAAPLAPFTYLSLPTSPAEQHVAASRWVERALSPAQSPLPTLALRTLSSRAPGERLRVGYLSSDFRHHAIAFLLTELLERHDKARMETFGYAYGPDDGSAERQRIRKAFEHWRDIDADSDEQASQRMRSDRLHVLIDLNGHTQYSRTAILARRPAPVQMSWLGYLGTLGAPWCDYIVTDRFVSPPEIQPHFSERFAYLPHCYCPSDTRRAIDARTPARSECGIPDDAFVFCSFSAGYKILPDVFAAWMRLLVRIDGSVLWLVANDPVSQANLVREAGRAGVGPRRLVFAPKVAQPLYLARLRCADLFLDTFPYNAGTTANDALFAGLPILTCAGATFASRVAGSQLLAAGLPELVTHSLDAYEATALRLAREPAALSAIRTRLAAAGSASPLFDMARFASDFEALLERVHRERERASSE
jgi:predicted O-linked N-acetylglucosamine transferase (SPINDLY family)